MTYKLSNEANEDIENIWYYTFINWSLVQADRYINLIFEEIEFLSTHPNSGKDYSFFKKNYRCSKVKSHLIFFKNSDNMNEIEIIRILHQNMDIVNRLRD
ncbi:MAG: type II toxin-antitoxin system RelE/ParE family toxin [Oligoflexus sp.]|nr:type II toxin-antitoxin system RelE/ParE family toxin [Pseudopedobacter sp.]